ncbi:unannotated protein [freshwater metagenome]|uniref:Unannotated protein n=1 Tax=freshwater metagenome TaxID=449393 RepID=A0A6J7BYS7_9ZZZZ
MGVVNGPDDGYEKVALCNGTGVSADRTGDDVVGARAAPE